MQQIKNIKYEEIVHPGISMACQSCSITSLCMILQYLGISDDSPDDAMKKIYEEFFLDKTSGKNGYNWILRGENLAKVLTEIYSVDKNKIELYSQNRKLRYSDIKNYLK